MALSVWRAVAWHGLSVGLSVVRLSRGPVCLPVVVHHYLSEPQFPTLRSAQWWTIRPPAMGESDQTGNCGLDVEKANTISPDQYNSRKHHKSINAVLNKVLLDDILQQKRLECAIGMNDARGCYD